MEAVIDATPGQLLERAYADHSAACRLYARQLLDPAGAEDATQEAFIRFMSHLVRAGEPPGAPRAWLLGATRSAAIDLIRADARRRDRERVAGRHDLFEPSPADTLDARDLAEALATLPQRQREAVVLRIWGGLGFVQIAEVLGIAVSTAHTTYQLALETLRTQFGEGIGPVSSLGSDNGHLERPHPVRQSAP